MGVKEYLYRIRLDNKKALPPLKQIAVVGKQGFGVIQRGTGRANAGFMSMALASQKTTASLGKQKGAAAALANQFNKIPRDKTVNIHTKGIGTANARLRQMDRSLMRMVRSAALFAGISFGVAGFGNATVGNQAQFEKSLSNVQALTDSTSESMALLRNSAKNAGETTVFSATKSAEAMGFLAMAGQTNNQIMASLPGTLDLAASGSIDLARAADIATNIMSQYGMAAADTNSMVDKLAHTQANANTNILQIAEAMNFWGPTAKALNVTLSESLGTIAILASNGLKGSLATRALGTSISRLAKPTRQAQDVMDKYNLTFFDAQGNFVGMTGLVKVLETRLGHLNPQQKQAALTAVFQSEAMQELNILLRAGSEELARFTAGVEKSEGAAKRMANTKLNNLSGDFVKLKSVAESYSISLGAELEPTLRRMTRISALWVRSLDTRQVGFHMRQTVITTWKLVRGIQANWGTIRLLAKGYLVLRIATFSYNSVLRIQAGLSALNTSRMAIMRGGLMAATTATQGATVATHGLNTAVKFSPIGAAISIVTALAGAYLLLGKNMSKATDRQNELSLAEDEFKFRREDFIRQQKQARSVLSLQDNPQLLENDPNLIRQKIQQAQMMRDFFKGESLSSRQFEELNEKTGFSILKKAEDELNKRGSLIVEPSSELARLLKLNEHTFIGKGQSNLISATLDQLRKDNPGLLEKPSSDSAKSKILANSLSNFIEFFTKKLPEEDPLNQAVNGDTDPGDFASAVDNELRGSASGGVRNVTVNMNIGEIINTVNAEGASEGIDQVMDQVMERLVRVLNEAGLQAKVVLSR